MKAGGLSFQDAKLLLLSVLQHTRHQFVADSISYEQIGSDGILGHQQVTDAYLAELARIAGMKLATLDRAQAALHPDVAELL